MKHYILLLCTWSSIINMHRISAEHIQYPLDTMHDVSVALDDDLETFDENQPVRKIKKIRQLCVGCLNVTKHLYVNGYEITSSSQTGVFSAAYGQLSLTTPQTILLDLSNTWFAIPFNVAGPHSNMGVTITSPATITAQKNGVYQINVSMFFLAENSDEGPFTPSTYTLGLSVNGVITPTANLSLTQSGYYLLAYNSFIQLSANDQVKFYMESSNGDDIFANHITLENGYAYLMQISN